MNNDQSATERGEPRPLGSGANAWTRFWFSAVSTTPMQCLRVLSGLLFFFWLASFLGHQVEIFSLNGWLDQATFQEVPWQQNHPASAIPWSILFLAGESVFLFQMIYFGSLALLALFTLGIATRITSVLTWVIVVSFLANPATVYDGDYLLVVLAFYLMIGHLLVGQWNGNLSLTERFIGAHQDFVFAPWLRSASPPPSGEGSGVDSPRPASYGANFMMRLFQLHFVLIIVTSALHKLQMSDWWTGIALWYPLHPTFKTTLESLQREAPHASFTLGYLSLAQYLVLAWQLALPTFAWRTGWWRIVLLGGAAIGWLGAFYLFRLPLFGPFVVIGCLSFLRAEEWTSVFDRIRVGGFRRPMKKRAVVSY